MICYRRAKIIARALLAGLMTGAFCFAAVAQDEEPLCPKISITVSSTAVRPREPIQFSAKIGEEVEKYNVEYFWLISSGKIISGQGSKNLLVEQTVRGDNVTATLEVKGLPEKCRSTESDTLIPEEPTSIKIDEFEFFGPSGTKGRLDNFLIDLTDHPDWEGVIVFREDKALVRQVKFLLGHLAFRNIDKTRITLVISGEKSQPIQFYRFPDGRDMVDRWEDALLIKLEDFEKLQKLFQPKPARSKNKK